MQRNIQIDWTFDFLEIFRNANRVSSTSKQSGRSIQLQFGKQRHIRNFAWTDVGFVGARNLFSDEVVHLGRVVCAKASMLRNPGS